MRGTHGTPQKARISTGVEADHIVSPIKVEINGIGANTIT